MVKNPPEDAGYVPVIPGLRRFHMPLLNGKKSREIFDPKCRVLLLKLDSYSGMMLEVKTFINYSISAYKMPMTCGHLRRSQEDQMKQFNLDI